MNFEQKELEEKRLRLSCLREASNLKQNSATANEYLDITVIELARQLYEFVIK